MTQNEKRKVVVNISLSLDGRTNGLRPPATSSRSLFKVG